jgi:hypothetical protein
LLGFFAGDMVAPINAPGLSLTSTGTWTDYRLDRVGMRDFHAHRHML